MTRTDDSDRPADLAHLGPAWSGSDLTPSTAQTGAPTLRNVIPITRDRRPARPPTTAPQTYTPAQVAQLLGISLSGVYNHLRAGTIPSRRIGARWLIPRRQFHAWLDGFDHQDDGDGDGGREVAY